MSIEKHADEIKAVLKGMLRGAPDHTRFEWLSLTQEEWKKAAEIHHFMRLSNFLLCMSSGAFEAILDGDIDLAATLEVVHQEVLKDESKPS
jgi:hypothetical protein